MRNSVRKRTFGPWHVLTASVPKPARASDGSENQDAVSWWEDANVLAVAVADGHGSSRSFRSARGARLAAGVAIDVLRDYAGEPIDDAVLRTVAEQLVEKWRAAVLADLDGDPISDEELAGAGVARNVVSADHFRVYGSTLLAALLTGEQGTIWQLGDGDVVAATDDEVWEPVPRDPQLVANETTSLCLLDASRHVRTGLLQDVTGLQLLLLGTDGVSNAMPEGWQRETALDLVGQLQVHGSDTVGAQLPAWLAEWAGHSGDDVTVALVHPRHEPPPAGDSTASELTKTSRTTDEEASGRIQTLVLAENDIGEPRTRETEPEGEPRRRAVRWPVVLGVVGAAVLLAVVGMAASAWLWW